MHLFGLMFTGMMYFLPTIIASSRNARSMTGIVLLNIFFGWTGIGWIVALIWALTGERRYGFYYR